ncbi:MAG: Hint domain-containing protein [Pseudomonadota bacterium]
MPSVFIISGGSISATAPDGSPTALGSASGGNGSHLGGLTIESGAGFTEVEITDTGGRSDWLEDSTGGQTLTNTTEIDGTTYAAGTAVEAEYQITLTDGDGNTYKAWALEIEDGVGKSFDNVVGLMFQADSVPPFGSELVVTGFLDLFNLPGTNTEEFQYSTGVPCFAAGTLIDTDTGPLPVEAVRPGTRVMTADAGCAEVLWAGARHLTANDLRLRPDLRPCVVQTGALGNVRPLMVSPQHRLLLTEASFATARTLFRTKGQRVRVAYGCRSVTYVHLLCERHQVIRSEGMWSETLYPGPEALRMMGPAQVRELLALFPDLRQVMARAGPGARETAHTVYGPLARPEVRRRQLAA